MKARTTKGRPAQRRSVSKRSEDVGIFKLRIEVAKTPDGPFRGVYALVDTGSIYTWVPGRILRELGVTPTSQYEFIMANGDRVLRDQAEAVIRLDDRVLHTIFVFGESTDQTLLGAYTLEGFALTVDPMRKRLVPMAELPAATTETVGG